MNRYRVKSGSKVKLAEIDPSDTSAFKGNKAEAGKELSRLTQRLDSFQELLYAERKHKVLIVLQGMDTSGKDGTIRHVFEGVNPQGVRVASFKVPSLEEQEHDYLWRIHKQTPGSGEMVIFNRSHYEDVLVARVHDLVSEKVWKKRYDQINAFEKMLAAEGTVILKFYLHIDRDEQKKRLQSRLDDDTKHWKFSSADLKERKLWDQYMQAYEEVLIRTSTDYAPWYTVPANHKWYRNMVVASVIDKTLAGLKMKYPPAEEGLNAIKIE
jgi:PPK2 family polyphosphate:nucleotide phosphotransferase